LVDPSFFFQAFLVQCLFVCHSLPISDFSLARPQVIDPLVPYFSPLTLPMDLEPIALQLPSFVEFRTITYPFLVGPVTVATPSCLNGLFVCR
jgi:hypothetical protein